MLFVFSKNLGKVFLELKDLKNGELTRRFTPNS